MANKANFKTVRSDTFVFSHLRTWKVHLWRNIEESSFIDVDGKYFKSAADVAFSFPMVEMCGERHYEFIPEILLVYNEENKLRKLFSIAKNVKGTGIVYVRNRRETQEVARQLTMQGISADFYHAGLDTPLRMKKQTAWKNSGVKVIVATNAFGMGIDKKIGISNRLILLGVQYRYH